MSKEFIVQRIEHLQVSDARVQGPRCRSRTVATLSVDGVILKHTVIQGRPVLADGGANGIFSQADKKTLLGWRDPQSDELLVISHEPTLLLILIGLALVAIALFELANTFYPPVEVLMHEFAQTNGVIGVILGSSILYGYAAMCLSIVGCLLLGSDSAMRRALEKALPSYRSEAAVETRR
jgi:hypothetical protein